MALQDKISRYGQGAGTNTSTISGRLEKLAVDVKNLVQIQGVLEGTAVSVNSTGSPSGRHESSNIEPIKSHGLAK